MQVNIKATNAELAPEAHDIIREKIGGLLKFYPNIVEADVEVGITTRHHAKGDIYRAEVNLSVPKKLLRAEAESDDISKSMNEVVATLKRELIKYKETHE
jgi:ribosomal subunit interface protein